VPNDTQPAPGKAAKWNDCTWVSRDGLRLYYRDYPGSEERPPLLIISGSDDTIMPEAVQKSNAKHYKLDTPHITFPGPHLLPGADNWQEVADYALTWALEQVTGETVTDLRADETAA
jgi:pimeloyl-ACP methyl ester carboxylesterase